MSVGLQGRFDVFVPQALGHDQDWDAHIDKHGGVGVPEIMQAYLLDAGGGAALVHLVMKVRLCVREKPVARLGLKERSLILPDNLAEFCR